MFHLMFYLLEGQPSSSELLSRRLLLSGPWRCWWRLKKVDEGHDNKSWRLVPTMAVMMTMILVMITTMLTFPALALAWSSSAWSFWCRRFSSAAFICLSCSAWFDQHCYRDQNRDSYQIDIVIKSILVMNHEKPEAGARAPPVAATAARRLPGVQPPDYSDGDHHNHHCDRKITM